MSGSNTRADKPWSPKAQAVRRAELAALIRQLRQDHRATVLLIEHDMSLVMGISDHIVVLDQGRVIAAGTPQIVANSPEVIHAYLGVEDSHHDTVEPA